MHRSGTSALGGVLNTMGLDAGSYLMPANETNPKGYFENRFVYWHNEKILNENKSKWSDSQFDISLISKENFQEYCNSAIEILEKEFKHSQNFFIKDPRICLLFPIWETACKQLDIDIRIIIPYRNPIEVAQSLTSRNDFTIEEGLILWAKHFYLAEYYSRNYKRIFLSFDYLVDNINSYIKELENFTQLDTSKSSLEKINHFIEKDYKHINVPINNFSLEVPAFLKDTVELLKQNNFSDAKLIDGIRNELNYLLKFFEGHNSTTSSQLEKERKLNSELINKQTEELKNLEKVKQQLQIEQEKNKEINVIKSQLEAEQENSKEIQEERNKEINVIKSQLEVEQEKSKEIQEEKNKEIIVIKNQLETEQEKSKEIQEERNKEINVIKSQLETEQKKSKEIIVIKSQLETEQGKHIKLTESIKSKDQEIEKIKNLVDIERSDKKTLLDLKQIDKNTIDKLTNQNEFFLKKITIIKNKAKSLISDSLGKVTELEKKHASKNEYIIEIQKSLELSKTDISDLKQNQLLIQQNLIRAKSKITHAMSDFTIACINNHDNQIQFKDNAANNIKQFHTLYTLHIGSKVAERIMLDNKINKIKSNPLSYLNPLRLKNIFMRLNELNARIESVEKKFNEIPWNIIESFNSFEYLESNDDVNQAIVTGQFINALEHFILFGYHEVQAGTRKFNSSSDTFILGKFSRSSKEKESLFNDFLTMQNKSFNLFQNNEFDLLINFELPVINDSYSKPRNLTKTTINNNLIELKNNDKSSNISDKTHKWLEIRGIELIVSEQGLDGLNLHNVSFINTNELTNTGTSTKYIENHNFKVSESISIQRYKNNSVKNKTLIIFSEIQNSCDLDNIINTYNLVIVCNGIIFNEELVQNIQPDQVICVFDNNAFPIESNPLSIPKELQEDYRFTKIINQSQRLPTKIKQNNQINLKKIKIAKPQNKFKYNIEYISAAGISGWIFNIDNRSKSSTIEILLIINDQDTVSVMNSIVREDVSRSYNLDCSSGFQINIPTKYLNGKKQKFNLLAKYENTYYVLKPFDFIAKSPWEIDNTDSKNKQNIVLFCSHNLRSQGAQNSLFELAIGLKRLYGITPIIQSPVDGPLSSKYKEHGIQVIIDNSLNKILDDVDEWSRQVEVCANKLKSLKCNILIANTLQTFSMVHAAKLANIPSVWIPRESEPPKFYFDYLSKPLKKLAELTFSIASQLVFVADSTRKIWDFMDSENSFKVIHNSLNTSLLNQDSINSRYEIRKSFGINNDDIVLLSLGTVSSRKGQLDFVQALPSVLSHANKPTKAIIVGMGSNPKSKTDEYSNIVRKTVEGFPEEIRNKIIMIPETDKLVNTKTYDFYSMADIFVFTSRIESFPRVILEAMYFSLPIVTTPCFGVVEQCINNYNALYYDEENINQLELELLELINNEKTRNSFAQGSKRLFENMQTYDQMLTNYHDVIKNLHLQETP